MLSWALSICSENLVIPVGNQMERAFFTGKKGIPSSFLGFTGGKSLSHSLRPTSTILYDEIHGLCQPCLTFQIEEPRLHRKRVNSMQKEHACPVKLCLLRKSHYCFWRKIITSFSFSFFIQMGLKAPLVLRNSLPENRMRRGV